MRKRVVVLVVVGTVAGGFLYAAHKAKRHLAEVQSLFPPSRPLLLPQNRDEIILLRMQSHFQSCRQNSEQTACAHVIEMRSHVLGILPGIETATNSLLHQSSNGPLDKKEKRVLWDQLKLDSFCLAIVGVFGASLVEVFVHLQLTLLYRHTFRCVTFGGMQSPNNTFPFGEHSESTKLSFLSLLSHISDTTLPIIEQTARNFMTKPQKTTEKQTPAVTTAENTAQASVDQTVENSTTTPKKKKKGLLFSPGVALDAEWSPEQMEEFLMLICQAVVNEVDWAESLLPEEEVITDFDPQLHQLVSELRLILASTGFRKVLMQQLETAIGFYVEKLFPPSMILPFVQTEADTNETTDTSETLSTTTTPTTAPTPTASNSQSDTKTSKINNNSNTISNAKYVGAKVVLRMKGSVSGMLVPDSALFWRLSSQLNDLCAVVFAADHS